MSEEMLCWRPPLCTPAAHDDDADYDEYDDDDDDDGQHTLLAHEKDRHEPISRILMALPPLRQAFSSPPHLSRTNPQSRELEDACGQYHFQTDIAPYVSETEQIETWCNRPNHIDI